MPGRARRHPIAGAALLQAQAGVDHAGVAIAAELVQAQARVLTQLQARRIGKFQRDAGFALGLYGVSDMQLLAGLDGAAGAAVSTGQFDFAADREHPRRCRFDAQPADGETQQLAGRQPVGIVDSVVLLELLPAHRGFQIHATQIPQGVAGADPVVPVLRGGDGRQQKEGTEQGALEAHGKQQRADEGHSFAIPAMRGAAARPHGPDLIPRTDRGGRTAAIVRIIARVQCRDSERTRLPFRTAGRPSCGGTGRPGPRRRSH